MKKFLIICTWFLLIGQVSAQIEAESDWQRQSHNPFGECGLQAQESSVQSFIAGLNNIDFFSEAACNPLMMKCNFVMLTRDDGSGAYPAGMLNWVEGSMNDRMADIRDEAGCDPGGGYPHDANIAFEIDHHYIADTESWDWYARALDIENDPMDSYGKYDFCPSGILNGNWPHLLSSVISGFNAAHPNEFNFFFVENGAHLEFLEEHVNNGTTPSAAWNDPNNFPIFGGCSRLAGD